MSKLILTVGLPASGKTTWVRERQIADTNVVAVSKDELRAMMHLSVFSKDNEREAILAEKAIVKMGLVDQRTVIVHNTHLNPAHVESYLRLLNTVSAGHTFQIKSFLDTPYHVCVARNKGRTGIARVPDNVIPDMYNKWFTNDEWKGLTKYARYFAA